MFFLRNDAAEKPRQITAVWRKSGTVLRLENFFRFERWFCGRRFSRESPLIPPSRQTLAARLKQLTARLMVESKLPKNILEKAVKNGKEYGWKETDLIEVINTAVENRLAIIGGQVQFAFEDGTCELYWLNYDSNNRFKNEDWLEYAKRTAKECIEKLQKIVSRNIELEALENFDFLKEKKAKGIDINDNLIFILYFEEESE